MFVLGIRWDLGKGWAASPTSWSFRWIFWSWVAVFFFVTQVGRWVVLLQSGKLSNRHEKSSSLMLFARKDCYFQWRLWLVCQEIGFLKFNIAFQIRLWTSGMLNMQGCPGVYACVRMFSARNFVGWWQKNTADSKGCHKKHLQHWGLSLKI